MTQTRARRHSYRYAYRDSLGEERVGAVQAHAASHAEIIARRRCREFGETFVKVNESSKKDGDK